MQSSNSVELTKMPRYKIEQYEVWVSATEVDAENPGEAIAKVLDGQGDSVDNSSEYVETDESRGLSCDQAKDLGIDDPLAEWGIPTIRSVEEVPNK
jgi:hypothetical protein